MSTPRDAGRRAPSSTAGLAGASADNVSEKDFQQAVIDLAVLCGFRTYHTHDSRRSTAGFPDLVLIRGDTLIVAELKSRRGKVTPAQHEWLDAFRAAGVAAHVWTPDDWPDLINHVLARPRTATHSALRSQVP